MGKNNVSSLLTSLDDLFTTQEERDTAKRETILDIPLSEISDFPNHPFKVRMDEAMMEMADSIRQYGVLVPGMVRQKPDGGYEMIAGHRRKMASELAQKETMPCLVRDLSDDEAIIIMIDSNLQRETLLPSEKAFAYRMKLEAMKRQGQRTDLTCAPVAQKSKTSREMLGEIVGESHDQIRRYIRLNSLLPCLLNLVDEGKIALRPAVELSYLTEDEQKDLYNTIESEDCTPSISQAQQMRKLSEQGKLDMVAVFQTMTKPKANQQEKVTLPYPKLPIDKIKRYAKTEPTPQVVQEFLLKAVEHYCRYLDRQKDKGAR